MEGIGALRASHAVVDANNLLRIFSGVLVTILCAVPPTAIHDTRAFDPTTLTNSTFFLNLSHNYCMCGGALPSVVLALDFGFSIHVLMGILYHAGTAILTSE